MTVVVENIVTQVKQLGREELDELLSWLTEYQLSIMDTWDREIEVDSRPGGRLANVISRVQRDITEGRTKPLDEVLDNA